MQLSRRPLRRPGREPCCHTLIWWQVQGKTRAPLALEVRPASLKPTEPETKNNDISHKRLLRQPEEPCCRMLISWQVQGKMRAPSALEVRPASLKPTEPETKNNDISHKRLLRQPEEPCCRMLISWQVQGKMRAPSALEVRPASLKPIEPEPRSTDA